MMRRAWPPHDIFAASMPDPRHNLNGDVPYRWSRFPDPVYDRGLVYEILMDDT